MFRVTVLGGGLALTKDVIVITSYSIYIANYRAESTCEYPELMIAIGSEYGRVG